MDRALSVSQVLGTAGTRAAPSGDNWGFIPHYRQDQGPSSTGWWGQSPLALAAQTPKLLAKMGQVKWVFLS